MEAQKALPLSGMIKRENFFGSASWILETYLAFVVLSDYVRVSRDASSALVSRPAFTPRDALRNLRGGDIVSGQCIAPCMDAPLKALPFMRWQWSRAGEPRRLGRSGVRQCGA